MTSLTPTDRLRTNRQLARQPGWIYRELGVEPIINCAGVRTNYGGSNPGPDVLIAMEAAGEAFVDMDELMAGVGQRLAELTGAEWGIVTSGSAAGLALATAACITGNNPQLMLALPWHLGPQPRVIMPLRHRFAYDHAIRMTGTRIVTVSSPDELMRALDSGAAMACALGRKDLGELGSFEQFATLCRQSAVPVLVDAAAQAPASPDPWLYRGADLVVYAGGKYVRGPQSTGFLLGKKALTHSAWLHAAPHQAWGRPMKVGKEEILGAVTALDRWLSRDNTYDQNQWSNRLHAIAWHLRDLPGVASDISPGTAETVVPRLRISWKADAYPINSEDIRQGLLHHKPRIMIHDFWATQNSITIDPFNLSKHEASLVGEVLSAVLGRARTRATCSSSAAAPSIDTTGEWRVLIDFLHGNAEHCLCLTQQGGEIRGSHSALGSLGDIIGTVEKNRVNAISRHSTTPMATYYRFEGAVAGDSMSGTLQLGAAADEHLGPVFQSQFGAGKWRAVRANTPVRSSGVNP